MKIHNSRRLLVDQSRDYLVQNSVSFNGQPGVLEKFKAEKGGKIKGICKRDF